MEALSLLVFICALCCLRTFLRGAATIIYSDSFNTSLSSTWYLSFGVWGATSAPLFCIRSYPRITASYEKPAGCWQWGGEQEIWGSFKMNVSLLSDIGGITAGRRSMTIGYPPFHNAGDHNLSTLPQLGFLFCGGIFYFMTMGGGRLWQCILVADKLPFVCSLSTHVVCTKVPHLYFPNYKKNH